MRVHSAAIVEEPDDEPNPTAVTVRHVQRQAPHHSQQSASGHLAPADPLSSLFDGMLGGTFGGGMLDDMHRMLSAMPQTGSGGSTFYSSSSYRSVGGSGGVTYESSSSMRRGPGGVEQQRTVRDGRSGEERMTLTRGVGERQRTLERVRCRDGQQTQEERLRGIESAEDATRFDEEWRQHAARGLPPEMGSHRRRAGQQHAPALGYGWRM